MTMLKTLAWCGAAVLILSAALLPATAQADGLGPLVAQQGQPGMMQQGQPGMMQGGQGGMRQQQGMPPQQGMPQGQQGGMMGQPGGQGGNANNCTQSYQRCVMMCAGVANCINNCNIGYALCSQPQGGRPGGS
jgi:hypothetical protein